MKIVVIGAGAAGLLAAGKAAETADEVVIIEKNDIIGKKLLNIELFGEFEGALGLLQRLDAVEGIDAWLIILFALAEHIHRYSKSFTYHGFISEVEASPRRKLW